MGNKKTTKKKPVVRKRGRNILKNVGKGPNININIDQSKKSTKKSIGQTSQPRHPSVISTFTPMGAPSPSYIPFPLPTPNLNPFESVVKETQKGKVKEEPNDLEKPKPREPEEERQNEEYPNVTMVEDLRTDSQRRRRRGSETSQQDEPQAPLLLNAPVRENNTPLDQQARQEAPTIATITPPTRERAGGMMTMTQLIERNENPPQEIPPVFFGPDRRVRDLPTNFQQINDAGIRLGGLFDRLNADQPISREERRRRQAEAAERRIAEEERKRQKPLLIAPEAPPEIPVEEEPQQESLKTEKMKKEESEYDAYKNYLLRSAKPKIPKSKDSSEYIDNPDYMEWQEFRKYAKSKGINVGTKKRQVINAELMDLKKQNKI